MSDELTVNRAVRGPAGDAPSRWRRALARRGPRRWLGLLLFAVACAGLAVLYYRQSMTAPLTSDGASNVLQGQAIAAGNPLLRGWWSSDVSFYSKSVTAWLVSHHERAGLAGYFQATSTTVTSGGQVLVAGITLPAGAAAGQPASDRPAAYRWESSADWYQPARHDATFVIAVADPTASGGGLPVPAVRASFGRPVAQYQVGNDVIMLYGYNLLTRLAPVAFPG